MSKKGPSQSPKKFDKPKCLKLSTCHMNPAVCKFLLLVVCIIIFRTLFSFPGLGGSRQDQFSLFPSFSPSLNSQSPIQNNKFLEVPQIVWGLNNQKIAFARACLTARLLNRTLLMPSLSASLFYKEVDLLEPVAFDKIFKFEEFNSRCKGFIQLGRFSDLTNQTEPFELHKGSGRKWTVERDMDQLKQCKKDPIDQAEVIRIVGKNPFLWHDHWPVKDYAKIFECLDVVDEISAEANKVVSQIRKIGGSLRSGNETNFHVPYVAVHMRIEKDWMIHCKKLEQRSNISQICSSKEEILERVAKIGGLQKPVIVYLAIADSLLEDSSILSGWEEGLVPFEKKRLGVWNTFNKYPYLVKSAIDYQVCLSADVFVGNSFSTFSSLVVLERTQKLLQMGVQTSCTVDVRWPSYAYNIQGELGGPQKWMIDMFDSSLRAVSYGSNNISC